MEIVLFQKQFHFNLRYFYLLVVWNDWQVRAMCQLYAVIIEMCYVCD